MSIEAKSPRATRPPIEPVLIFRGGGYDGCFWEWNALFFDIHKKLLPDQQGYSGRAGERVYEAAQRSLNAAIMAAAGEGEFLLITSERKWKYFIEEWNAGFVRSVCRVAQHDLQCGSCKQWFDPDEIVHTGYRGNGGIGVQYDDNTCLECADEEHNKFCAEEVWPHDLSIKERVEAIQKAKKDGIEVSIFAARRKVAPIPYDYYTSEGEYY